MDNISRLLAEAAAGTPSVSDTKKQNVLQAVQQKKQELGGPIPSDQEFYNNSVGQDRNVGNATLSPIMEDVRNLNPMDLIARYGPDGAALLAGRVRADSKRITDQAAQRDASETAADIVSGAGLGVANGVLGIGALAAGVVSPDAAAWAVKNLDKLNEWGQSTQSTALEASRRLYAAQAAEASRDAEGQQKANKAAGDSSFVAGIKRVGTDIIDTAENLIDNPRSAGDIVSNAFGSLATAGPVGKGISNIAGKALEKKIGKGKALEYLASETGAVTAGIGLTEGAGAYQQSSSEVLKMTHDDLMKNSTEYRDRLKEMGDTPTNRESLKNELANESGMISAGLTAPAALALGSTVAKFEAHPTAAAANGVKGMLANAGRETIEEAGTGAASQVASNLAIQRKANENKTLTEGVGEQITQGAVGGFGSAVGIQGPGQAVQAVMGAASKAVDAVDKAATTATKKQEAANVADAPQAAEKVVEAANTVAAQAVEANANINITPEPSEQDAAVGKHFEKVAATMAFDNAAETTGMPESQLKTELSSATNSVDALNRASKVLTNDSLDNDERMAAARMVESLVGRIRQGTAVEDSLWESLPDEHPLVQQMNDLDGQINTIISSPLIQESMQKITAAVNTAVDQGKITPISDTDTNVEQKINDNVMAVKYGDAEKIDPELPKNILFHAKKNNITLAPETVNALNAVEGLIKARQAYADSIQNSGNPTPSEKVSLEIESIGKGQGSKGESFLTQFNDIRDAMNQGNILEAQGLMDNMAQFVQHMSNKVQAVNEHYEGGNSKAPKRTYQALNPTTRMWYNSSSSEDGLALGLDVAPFDAKSVGFAQRVGREAQFGESLYNALSQAYPDLQSGTATVAKLNPALTGNTLNVSKQHTGKPQDLGRQQTNAYARSADAVTGSPRVTSMLGQAAAGGNAIPDSAKKVKVKNHTLFVAEDGSTVWDVNGKALKSQNWIDAALTASGLTTAVPAFETPETQQKSSESKQKASTAEAKVSDVSPAQNSQPDTQPETRKTDTQQSSESKTTSEPPKVKENQSAPEPKQQRQEPVADTKLATKSQDTPDVSELREQLKAAQEELSDSTEAMAEAQAELEKLSAKPEQPKKAVFVARRKAVRQITDTPRAIEKARLAEDPAGDPTQAPDEKIINTYDLIGDEHGDIEPWFAKAYRVPKKAISYLFGSTQGAFDAVVNALDNAGLMNKLRNGEPMKKVYSQQQSTAVADFIEQYGDSIKEHMNFLKDEKFLNKKVSDTAEKNAGKTYRQLLDEGNDLIQDYSAGAGLAITDSNYEYNQNLLESAILAGINYLIAGNKLTPNMDEKTAKEIFGFTEDSSVIISAEITNKLENSVDEDAVIRDIANNIKEYWGIKDNPNTNLNYTRGIAEAIAANVMASILATTGLVTRDTLKLEGLPNKAIRYTFNQQAIDKALNNQKGISDLLDQTILTEPKDTYHFDPNRVPSRDTQVHSDVPITADQKQVQDNEKRNPFKFNVPMMALYKVVGNDSLIRILGGGEMVGDRVLNKNHENSLDGKNMAVRAALSQLEDMIAVAQQHADENGIAFDDVEQFFEYAFTTVNRMHMQGRYNAQSNKTIREIVMPNESIINLMDDKTHYNYIKALGQALGVKVHNQMSEANIEKVLELINGKFKPAIDMLAEQTFTSEDYNSDSIALERTDDEFGRELAAAIDDSFGSGKATAVGIHALVDYVRYTRSTDLNNFRTMMYLEADGVTNGAANSMMMFISGLFDKNWLTNMRKVGLFFKPTTMNEHRSSIDSVDLYETSADHTATSIGNDYNQVTDKKLKRSFVDMFRVLDSLSDDVIITQLENGQASIKLDRGFMKNPLTVTLYGSGMDGISAKIVREVMKEAFYERASNISAFNPKMTMDHPDAGIHFFNDLKISDTDKIIKYNMLRQSLQNMANNEVVVLPTRERIIRTVNNPIDWRMRAADFSFTNNMENMWAANTSALITSHINTGIRATVGDDLMRSLELVKVTINAQSVMLQKLYASEVRRALDAKRENPLWGASDFLSQAELDEIAKKLEFMSPLIQTGRQNFNISGGEKATIPNLSFSRAFNDLIRTKALFSAPSAAGVKAIPYLNIGMGDGLMMQILSQMPELKGTLKIFDGMHMPIDKIDEYGVLANKAVIETWTNNNPVAGVLEAYKRMADNLRDDLDISIDDWRDVFRASLTADERPIYDVDSMDETEIISLLKDKAIDLSIKANGIAGRQAAIREANIFVDQMAASETPASNNGKKDFSAMEDDQIISELNTAYFKNTAIPTRQSTDAEGREILARTRNQEAVALPNGTTGTVGTLNPEGVRRYLKNLQATKEQKVMIREVDRLISKEGISVVFGSKESIAAKLGDAAPDRLADPGTTVNGWFDSSNKTIYLIDGSTETILHELIHATTFNKVLQHYSTDQVDATTTESINEIEKLMNDYLGSDMADGDLVNEVLNIQNQDDLTEPMKQARTLNEFMAWALSNRSISTSLANKSLPEGVKAIAQKVFQAIRKMLWPRISDKNVPQPMDDFLGTLQFHTGVVMRSQAKFSTDAAAVNLFMARKFGGSDLAQRTSEAMMNKLVAFMKPEAIKEFTRVNPNAPVPQAAILRATGNATTITNTAVAAGFQLNPHDAKVFADMVTVLGTGASIDPIFLAQAQTLYDHAIKNMTRESFLADPTTTDPNAIAEAQTKYDLVTGKAGVVADAYGRSSILPTFIALAMTSPEFNKVLSNIKTPKMVKNMAGTLDAALENIGNAGMEKLGEWASGQGMNQKNIASALSAMSNDLVRNHQDAAGIITKTGDLFAEQVDKANAFMVKNMQKGADKLIAAANRTKSRTLKNASLVLASVVSDTHASNAAETLNEAMGGVNGLHAFRDLMGDVLGRLDSNASVYDMVKTVRAMVQQTRQQYKEELPKTLRSKFKTQLNKSQWNSLHAGLGKTDIASLFGSLGNSGIKEILTDQQKLVDQIKNVEAGIQATYPSNWAVLQAKSAQLAEFLNTGKTGNNLLRNAYAVASMLGENGFVKGQKPNPDLVNAIDQLVSLYAVRDMAPAHKQEIRTLMTTEPDGINYLIGSLKVQRQTEMDKAKSAGSIQLNNYKGYLPTTMAENTSIIVADSAQHAQLLARGYKRIAPYKGSNVDLDAAGLSYYLADHPTNSSFNQGIAQNVRMTANGVDTVSGRTTNLHGAGRITNGSLIGQIRQLKRKATGDFRLMPVYNSDGDVVAMERSLDPAIINQSKPMQDLASSIGIWRGRQMEESMAKEVNHRLVDNLNEMYKLDRRTNKHNDSYINLLDEKEVAKDPVLKDAVALLSNDIRNYAESVFGSKQFMVRKDMLKEAIGYREASLGDAFTGNTRWGKESTQRMRGISQAIWGNDAYNKLTTYERNWQGLMHDARVMIVVKSMIVPVANMVSNVLQLKGRGVTWSAIANGIPRKLKETEFYVQSQIEKIQLEADLAAETAPNQLVKIRTRLKTIDDSQKRLGIWPLIQAGEFSAVTDVGVVSEEDVDLVGGKLHQYIDKAVNKLPEAVRTVGRYAVISQDTALFRGLQKSVQYGDFLAKAILFDDMMTRQKLTQEQALAKITEEFVNYDILPGRNRGYLEKMGLMWFYNFKLRAAKIGFNMLRNNPVHSLIAMHIPTPDGLGAGMPISDSISGKLMNGAFTYSLGPGMGLRAPTLLPWINMVD